MLTLGVDICQEKASNLLLVKVPSPGVIRMGAVMVVTGIVAELVISPEPWGLVTARTTDEIRVKRVLSIKESI